MLTYRWQVCRDIIHAEGFIMNLDELYNYAEKRNIEIHSRKHDKKPAFVVEVDGDYHLSIDYSLIQSERQELYIVAEEIGHCETNSLYPLSQVRNPLYKSNIDKAERRARDWATQALVPFDALLNAIEDTRDESELCDRLNISPAVLYYAVSYYKRKCLI